MALKVSIASKSAHLTPEQIEEFGHRVEQIRQDVMQSPDESPNDFGKS
ncbi:acyl-CoA desaturase, partial [Acinetobacter baumannii]|nr:acyl-CoA desaturase [Acinetobacter baumannii]